MIQEPMEMAQSVPVETLPANTEEVTTHCATCETTATTVCHRCQADLCESHTYRETNGTLDYCRRCADFIVGVCTVCDALHARPCRECGMKVCAEHQKRVIERWGWGGAPGQGGVVSWFPMIGTYCQEHGKNRFDLPKPVQRTFTGYDGSSPEW